MRWDACAWTYVAGKAEAEAGERCVRHDQHPTPISHSTSVPSFSNHPPILHHSSTHLIVVTDHGPLITQQHQRRLGLITPSNPTQRPRSILIIYKSPSFSLFVVYQRIYAQYWRVIIERGEGVRRA